ncbi:MAG: hypothetical protein ACFBWO_01585 [Paracoccaceae bacterium]
MCYVDDRLHEMLTVHVLYLVFGARVLLHTRPWESRAKLPFLAAPAAFVLCALTSYGLPVVVSWQPLWIEAARDAHDASLRLLLLAAAWLAVGPVPRALGRAADSGTAPRALGRAANPDTAPRALGRAARPDPASRAR